MCRVWCVSCRVACVWCDAKVYPVAAEGVGESVVEVPRQAEVARVCVEFKRASNQYTAGAPAKYLRKTWGVVGQACTTNRSCVEVFVSALVDGLHLGRHAAVVEVLPGEEDFDDDRDGVVDAPGGGGPLVDERRVHGQSHRELARYGVRVELCATRARARQQA